MAYISVIIPTYKRVEELKCAVNSVLAQEFQDFEVIIVNDAADELRFSDLDIADSRVKLIANDQNRGKTYSLVHAAKNCAGNYLAFLDDDDLWLPDHLSQIVKAIESTPDSALTLFFTRLVIKSERGESIRPPSSKDDGVSFLNYILENQGLIQNSAICLSRDYFRSFDFDLSNRKHVDYDICMWVEYTGGKFIMLDRPTVIWNCYSSQSGSRLSKSAVNHSEAWLSKWELRKGSRFSAYERNAFFAFHQAPLLAGTDFLRALKLLCIAALSGYFSARLMYRCLRAAIKGV